MKTMNKNDETKQNNFNNDSIDGNGQLDNEHESQCADQIVELTEKYQHLAADFQNYRNRMLKEKAEWYQSAQIDVLKSLLPIIDDFERALHHVDSKNENIAGFAMIQKSLQKMLMTHGVSPITDLSSFDPEKHEAIVQVDAPNVSSGDIVAVLETGYEAKGRVLRPAKVSVAR